MSMPAANIRPTSRKAIVPPGWQQFYDETGVSAAIRHGDMLYVTGHTGEDDDLTFSADLEHQIRRTFINLALTLAEAGTDWSDVVEIVSYHVGLREQADALTRISREFLAPPSPAWSAVGVAELWDEGAVIEMSCVAAIGGPNGSPP